MTCSASAVSSGCTPPARVADAMRASSSARNSSTAVHATGSDACDKDAWRLSAPRQATATVRQVASTLTEAQLDGRACIGCGAEALPRRPVEAWSRLGSQLFECVDTEGYRHRCGGRTEGLAE